MATDVGSIYLEVFADTKALKAQVRKAAKDAGKAFGKDFDEAAAPGLSGLGESIVRDMGKNGRLSGKQFVAEFRKESVGIARGFDADIARTLASGDWDKVFSNFKNLDEAVDRTNARLGELNKGGSLTKALKVYGLTLDDVRGQMNAYADEARRTGEEVERTAQHEKEAAAESERLANNQKFLAQATEESRRALKAQNDEMARGMAERSAKDTARLRNETDLLQNSLRKANVHLKEFGNTDVGKTQKKRITELVAGYTDLDDRLRGILHTHNETTAGMDKNSAGFIRQTNKTRKAVAELGGEVDVLGTKMGGLNSRSARLSTALRKAFANDPDKSGLGRGLDFVTQKWKEFAIAMPAGLQFILANLLLVIGPLSTIGSAIGSVLIPLVGALSVAVGGLAAAFAGIGTAAVAAVALAVGAFKTFEDEFPATYEAIQGIKTAFEELAIPAFAAEWSESVRIFAETLREQIDFTALGTSLGAATDAITEAFTGVLQSPAFTGFMAALQGPLANAVAAIGQGLAGVFGVALQWMTAAAPLAEHIGALFATWATNLNAALATTEGQQALTDFMTLARTIIDALVPLVSNLAQAFNNIFLAGAETGAGFLQTLAQLAGQFNAWTASAAGQEALNQLFRQGKDVFDALIPLLGALGTAFASMVTPATVQSFIVFMNAITQILPIFAQLISAVQEIGAFDLLASLFQIIGTAVQPLIPALSSLAGIIGGQLAVLFSAFAPILNIIGELLAQLAPVVGTLVAALGGALVTVVQALAPLFATLAAALLPIADAIIALLVPILPVLGELLAAAANVVTALVQALLPLLPVVVVVADIFGQVLASALDVIMPLFDILAETIIALSPIISTLAGILVELLPSITPLIVSIFELSAVFVPIIGLIPPLISMLMPLITMFIQLQSALVPLITTVLGFVSELIPKITELATQLIEGLVGGLTSGITAVTDWITGFVDTVLTTFKDLFGIHSPSTVFMDFGVDLLQGLVDGLVSMMSAVGTFFSDLWTNVSTWVSEGLATVIAFFAELPGNVISAVTGLIAMVGSWMSDVWAKMSRAIETGWSAVLSFFTGLPGKIMNAINGLIGMITTFGSNVINGFKSGLESAWGAVSSWVLGIQGKILGLVGSGLDLLRDVGSNIVQGLANGLSGAWHKVTSKVNDLIGKIPKAVRDLLGIGSPSKVFMEIGTQTMQGLGIGLDKSSRAVIEDARGIAQSLTNTFNVGSSSSLGVNPARGGGNQSNPIGRPLAGATVASGAIQIVTPVKDPAIVASMVLDGLVARAQ